MYSAVGLGPTAGRRCEAAIMSTTSAKYATLTATEIESPAYREWTRQQAYGEHSAIKCVAVSPTVGETQVLHVVSDNKQNMSTWTPDGITQVHTLSLRAVYKFA